MDYDQFKASLRSLRKQFKDTVGLAWGNPRLQPAYDPIGGELLSWKCVWVVSFENTLHFIRLKENWHASGSSFERGFFSYHYGPYELGWDLETVECKAVTVRVDGINYSGRGCHVHDGSKDARIFQDQLQAPELAKIPMEDFINGVLAMRYGKTLAEAFGLKFK